MNGNGLTIDEKDFMKLNLKEQNRVLFENQLATIKMVKSYKFHQKIQYVIISMLIIGVGVLLQMHLK